MKARFYLLSGIFGLAGMAAISPGQDQGSKPQINTPVFEAAKFVTGTAAAGDAVAICDVTTGQALQSGSVTASGSGAGSGTFTANLQNPLVAGQQIQIHQAAGSSVSCSAAAVSDPVTVQGVADWGRVRGTFAAGTVLANNNSFQAQGLTQSSLFLDFVIDKNWRTGGVTQDPSDPKTLHWAGHGARHPILINSFFETRLTSIPETQQNVASSGTATTGTSGTSTATTGTGSTTGTTSTGSTASTQNGQDVLSTFIGSRKSALMQGGVYFPILINKWIFQNTPNALSIAPLAKIGFITPTSPGTTVTSPNTTVMPLNTQQFYNYYGWGARVGHFKLSYDYQNEAPELISYLDVIVGRYSNLETLVPDLNGAGQAIVGANGLPFARPIRQYRVGIEGSLKVPSTPLLLGFSANLGQNLFSTHRLQAPNDDLRFFIGTKFDIGSVLSKVQHF